MSNSNYFHNKGNEYYNLNIHLIESYFNDKGEKHLAKIMVRIYKEHQKTIVRLICL